MINGPDQIFAKRHSGPSGYHTEAFHDDDHVARTLTRLLDDASTAHRKLDPAEGLQDAQLSSGARIHIVHGDLARGGHLLVNIRKFTGVAFRTLDELVERDMLGPAAADFLAAAVRATQSAQRRSTGPGQADGGPVPKIWSSRSPAWRCWSETVWV
jgi:pilus assembly protein CpaF